MTIPRAMGVLTGVMLMMIAVVLVRAETARLENDHARLERQEASLRLEAREQEIEIARLRNPVLLHARVVEMWGIDEKPAKGSARNNGKAEPALPKRTGGRTPGGKPPADSRPGKTTTAKRGG